MKNLRYFFLIFILFLHDASTINNDVVASSIIIAAVITVFTLED